MNITYDELNKEVKALLSPEDGLLSSACNVVALLWEHLPDCNWLGFYYVDGDILRVGPFQGKIACTKIQYAKGVCGTTWAKNEIQLVEDVHAFPGHIACDSASNSEIVLPINKNNQVFAVLDIDSPSIGRFTEEDREGLALIVSSLEEFLSML